MKIQLIKVLMVLFCLLILVVPVLAQFKPGQAQEIEHANDLSLLSQAPNINQMSLPALITTTPPLISEPKAIDPVGVQRLSDDTGGANISISLATGAARFVRLSTAQANRLAAQLGTSASVEEQATAFFKAYGSIFGISDAATELNLVSTTTDDLGATHLAYQQVYQGVPIFAGLVRVHFNPNKQIIAVNGTFIPHISLDSNPSLSEEKAAAIAVDSVAAQLSVSGLAARRQTLYVFRANLARGVPDTNYLVYEVEVGDGANVREFVYVDAHTGKIVDQISGIHEALNRNVYSGTFNIAARVWQEGDPLPYVGATVTETTDINNLIDGSGESYDLFSNAFGRDSYDGAGAAMHTVNNDPTIFCPNANWNSVTTNYCTGVTGDDTVAHEWGHAYTEYTSNLIYQWQSGALNESFSDIWGDVVDLINGRGLDIPGGVRTDENACSTFSTPRKFVTVNTPAGIAGSYATAGADFGPALTGAGTTGDLVLVDDGAGDSTTDACEPLTNGGAVSGNIALIELADFVGPCGPTTAVKNAQNAGAIAAVVINDTDSVRLMQGVDPTITIPSGKVGNRIGNLIKAELGSGVNVTMHLDTTSAENSYRWLSGEDDPAFGEAIRDMWDPTCYRHPGKVSDSQYHCSADDGGGVHRNSGIPNHAFALMVDGGNYNGQTITGIGLTKAAHIHFRAQSVYEVPATDFADHADALEMACADLVGTNLNDLSTGAPSGEIISTADCTEVAETMQAVEMRDSPIQCNFQPVLAQSPPPLCAAQGGARTPVFFDNFETVMTTTWTLTNQGVFAEYTPRDWQWRSNLPENRSGFAFVGVDDPNLGDCFPGSDDQSGVVFLVSPVITLPTTTATVDLNLVFEHNVATETGWDGGNLKVSVNGGPFQLITSTNFIYNAYNSGINPAGLGNTNPLEGQPGFTGTDGGSVISQWGQSQIDLSSYAGPGDAVQLRFDFGTDGCGGVDGWYVDNVQLNYCGIQMSYLPTIYKQ